MPYLEDDFTEVARAVARLGRQEGIDALVRSLRTVMSWQAAVALGFVGGRAPIQPLLEALGTGIPVSTPTEAMASLLATHPEALPEIAAKLIETLRGEHIWEPLETHRQSRVALALGSLSSHDPLLVDRLVALLDWPHWETKLYAASALGKLGSAIPPEAVERLRALRDTPESEPLRTTVRRVLDDLKTTDD